MRSLRTDLTMALGAVALLLTALGLSQGCRPERPNTPGQNPAVDGTDGTDGANGANDPAGQAESEIPDEPAVALRKELQGRGYTVVTMEPSLFFTWVDGTLSAGPDLELRMAELKKSNSDVKLAVVIAKADETPWLGMVRLRERMNQFGIPYKLVFAGYPGLAPAVSAEEGGTPPGLPTPPEAPPGLPPGQPGAGGH